MPIYSKDDVRILHIHVPKTGGTSISEQFFREGWAVDYHTRLSRKAIDNRAEDCEEPVQNLHYERLKEWGLLDSPYQLIFMGCRHPFNRFVSEYIFRKRSLMYRGRVEVNKYLEFIYSRTSTSFASNHIRKLIDFHGEKVQYIKKQESESLSLPLMVCLAKYIDVSNLPRFYQQSYDISEFEPYRTEVESLYSEDMYFFGY